MAILASNQYTIIDYTDVYIDVSPGSILIPVDTNNKPINSGNTLISVKFKNGGGEVLTHNNEDNVSASNITFNYSNTNNLWTATYGWSNTDIINAQDITITGTYKTYTAIAVVHIMPIAQGTDGDTITDVKELYFFDNPDDENKPQNPVYPERDNINYTWPPKPGINNNVGDNKDWQYSPYGTWVANANYWTCSQIIYNNGASIGYTLPIRAENFNVSYEARAEAASKIRTYYSTSNERTQFSSENLHDGDLWYDSNDDNKIYRWTKNNNNEYEWKAISDPRLDNLIDDDDGEITIYYDEKNPASADPNPVQENDIWYDSTQFPATLWHYTEENENKYKVLEKGKDENGKDKLDEWTLLNTENDLKKIVLLNDLLESLENLEIKTPVYDDDSGNEEPLIYNVSDGRITLVSPISGIYIVYNTTLSANEGKNGEVYFTVPDENNNFSPVMYPYSGWTRLYRNYGTTKESSHDIYIDNDTGTPYWSLLKPNEYCKLEYHIPLSGSPSSAHYAVLGYELSIQIQGLEDKYIWIKPTSTLSNFENTVYIEWINEQQEKEERAISLTANTWKTTQLIPFSSCKTINVKIPFFNTNPIDEEEKVTIEIDFTNSSRVQPSDE